MAIRHGNVAQVIKSIQRGTIVVANGNGSNTGTITSVDTTKSLLSNLGTDNAGSLIRIVLTNATTITATRLDTTGNDTVSFEVVEYY